MAAYLDYVQVLKGSFSVFELDRSWIDTKQDTQHLRRLKVISMEDNAIRGRSQTHLNNECHVLNTNIWQN